MSDSSVSRVSAASSSTERPTLLLIGRSDSFQEALVQRLSQRALHVETALPEQAVEAAVVTAPDLIVLAADLGGKGLLEQLVSSAVSSVIPIVLLQDEEPLDARLRAFRRGASAVVARTASVDSVAERLTRLAYEIPERDGDVDTASGVNLDGGAGEATLEEFVRMLASELRSGILSVESGVANAPLRLVLGAGRPLLSAVDEFVSRIAQQVVHAEPLRYEFDDRAGGTLAIWNDEASRGRLGRGDVSKLRLMLCDDDPARVDQVAQELRDRGAHVAVSSLNPDALELRDLRQFDPEVVVMSEAAIAGAGYDLLRRMKQDLRLRWASLLVVRWEQIFELDRTVPGFDRFTALLAGLAEVDRGMSDRAELGDAFDARLEVNGPARCLRALARTGQSLSVVVQHARAEVRLELARGLIVSAWARGRQDGTVWEGALALSVLLGLRTGRVHVAPIEQASTANLMAEVELALDWAEREASPLAPSRPSGESVAHLGWPKSVHTEAASAGVQISQTVVVGPQETSAPAPLQIDSSPQGSMLGGAGLGESAGVPATTSPRVDPASSQSPAPLSRVDSAPAEAVSGTSLLERALTSRPLAATLSSLDAGLRALSLSIQARRSRLTREWVVFLLGLAVLQGLVIAYALKLLLQRNSPQPNPVAAASLPDKQAPALTRPSISTREPRLAASGPSLASARPASPMGTPGGVAGGGVTSSNSGAQAPEPTIASEPPSAASETSNPEVSPEAPMPGGCETTRAATPTAAASKAGASSALQALKAARHALMQGELEAAQHAYCEAIELEPSNARLHFELAQLLLIRGQAAAAVEWAKRGVKLEPSNARGFELIGDGLARLGDTPGARRAWFAAADFENPSAIQIQRLAQEALREAQTAARQRDPARAERFYTRAALLGPENAVAELGLARAQLKLGEKDLALPHARKAAELSPKEPRAHLLLGDALLATGDAAGARDAFRKADRLGLPEARRRLARLDTQ